MKANLLSKAGLLATAGALLGGASTAQAADPYDKALESRVAALERELNLMQGDDKGKGVKPTEVPTFMRARGKNVRELTIGGDFRLRYQFQDFTAQLPRNTFYPAGSNFATAGTPFPAGDARNALQGFNNDHYQQSNRPNRYRLRIYFDYQLSDDFFLGWSLASGDNPGNDGTTSTIANGFGKQNIWLDQAYLGWKKGPLTVVGGKYVWAFFQVDDFVFDKTDLRPTGLTELYKMDLSPTVNLEIIAGQYIYTDAVENNQNQFFNINPGQGAFLTGTGAPPTGSGLPVSNAAGATSASLGKDDSVLMVTQAVFTIKPSNVFNIKIAPMFTFYAVAGGVNNPTSLAGGAVNGVPAAITGATFNSLPLNITNGPGAVNNTASYINGKLTNRNLYLLTLPVEASFTLGSGLVVKPFAEVTYNFAGGARNYKEYGVALDNFSSKIAFVAGVKLGELKKKGDWAIQLDYRHMGLGSHDPNLNDPNWSLSRLNMRGIKAGLAYRFTNWLTGNINYYHANNIERDLYSVAVGGPATGFYRPKVAPTPGDYNTARVLQVELNATF